MGLFCRRGMLLVVSIQLKHDVDHNLFGVYQYQWQSWQAEALLPPTGLTRLVYLQLS